jgi:hypothetical protein
VKKIISVVILSVFLISSAPLDAAQGPMEKFADKTIDRVEKHCQTELETYCQTVTPGEGRGMACLYAHSDKLSSSCSAALNEATSEFKNATDNVNAFIADCQADIYQLCSKVAIGEGRILACLEKNKKTLAVKCREQLKNAHGDFGKANQIS